ncbi:MAG TPA: uroporphyrinogen-III C-methyltransferase, partial [Algoriphagus sp.]|nr:uroporphyrinogen-III C-methyltransferase [Algoriphagus sp.]
DLALAAQSTATVVVLMGTKKLNEIVQTYRNAGRENLPVAIIQSGTTREEKITAGFIYDIAQKAVENQVESPAIIIIGEVVRESMRLEEVYREFVKIEMQ